MNAFVDLQYWLFRIEKACKDKHTSLYKYDLRIYKYVVTSNGEIRVTLNSSTEFEHEDVERDIKYLVHPRCFVSHNTSNPQYAFITIYATIVAEHIKIKARQTLPTSEDIQICFQMSYKKIMFLLINTLVLLYYCYLLSVHWNEYHQPWKCIPDIITGILSDWIDYFKRQQQKYQ